MQTISVVSEKVGGVTKASSCDLSRNESQVSYLNSHSSKHPQNGQDPLADQVYTSPSCNKPRLITLETSYAIAILPSSLHLLLPEINWMIWCSFAVAANFSVLTDYTQNVTCACSIITKLILGGVKYWIP